jgi:hypothetical protein
MFIVRGTCKAGFRSYACGTADQAYEKVTQLLGRGFENITVTDPSGRCRTAEEFLRVSDNDDCR